MAGLGKNPILIQKSDNYPISDEVGLAKNPSLSKNPITIKFAMRWV